MQRLFFLSAIVLCLCFWSCGAWAAISLQKNLPLSARDMEFYYQRSNPEVLPSMLRAFERAKKFEQADTRMLVASFLAEVVRSNGKALDVILPLARELGPNGRRMLAWMSHLAALPNEKDLLESLLGPTDNVLRRIIVQSPRQIDQWNIYGEKTVLHMYWASYFATGNTASLDTIIQATLRYSRLNARGRQQDRVFPLCQAAAASLYELAPRHEGVRLRVAETLAGLSGPEADTLQVILRQKQAKG